MICTTNCYFYFIQEIILFCQRLNSCGSKSSYCQRINSLNLGAKSKMPLLSIYLSSCPQSNQNALNFLIQLKLRWAIYQKVQSIAIESPFLFSRNFILIVLVCGFCCILPLLYFLNHLFQTKADSHVYMHHMNPCNMRNNLIFHPNILLCSLLIVSLHQHFFFLI
jgi:hypothetical protein